MIKFRLAAAFVLWFYSHTLPIAALKMNSIDTTLPASLRPEYSRRVKPPENRSAALLHHGLMSVECPSQAPRPRKVSMWSQMIFPAPRIGMARITPGAPHIQAQNSSDKLTARGFSWRRSPITFGYTSCWAAAFSSITWMRSLLRGKLLRAGSLA